MYERIVVPLDGSGLAEQALPEAVALAHLTGAPLHLIRVVDVTRLEQYGAYGLALEYAGLAKVVTEEEANARAYLGQVASRLSGEGAQGVPRVTIEVRRGLVVRELIAATRPGDLLVMATHGHGGIRRWLLGSVAEEVVRHTSGPVHLVRARTQEAERNPEGAPAAARGG